MDITGLDLTVLSYMYKSLSTDIVKIPDTRIFLLGHMLLDGCLVFIDTLAGDDVMTPIEESNKNVCMKCLQ